MLIDMVERARARGVDIWGDVYPYNTSGSDGEIVLIPRWAVGPAGEAPSTSAGTDYAAALRKTLRDPKPAANVMLDVTHQLQLRRRASNLRILDFPDKQFLGKTVGWVRQT